MCCHLQRGQNCSKGGPPFCEESVRLRRVHILHGAFLDVWSQVSGHLDGKTSDAEILQIFAQSGRCGLGARNLRADGLSDDSSSEEESGVTLRGGRGGNLNKMKLVRAAVSNDDGIKGSVVGVEVASKNVDKLRYILGNFEAGSEEVVPVVSATGVVGALVVPGRGGAAPSAAGPGGGPRAPGGAAASSSSGEEQTLLEEAKKTAVGEIDVLRMLLEHFADDSVEDWTNWIDAHKTLAFTNSKIKSQAGMMLVRTVLRECVKQGALKWRQGVIASGDSSKETRGIVGIVFEKAVADEILADMERLAMCEPEDLSSSDDEDEGGRHDGGKADRLGASQGGQDRDDDSGEYLRKKRKAGQNDAGSSKDGDFFGSALVAHGGGAGFDAGQPNFVRRKRQKPNPPAQKGTNGASDGKNRTDMMSGVLVGIGDRIGGAPSSTPALPIKQKSDAGVGEGRLAKLRMLEKLGCNQGMGGTKLGKLKKSTEDLARNKRKSVVVGGGIGEGNGRLTGGKWASNDRWTTTHEDQRGNDPFSEDENENEFFRLDYNMEDSPKNASTELVQPEMDPVAQVAAAEMAAEAARTAQAQQQQAPALNREAMQRELEGLFELGGLSRGQEARLNELLVLLSGEDQVGSVGAAPGAPPGGSGPLAPPSPRPVVGGGAPASEKITPPRNAFLEDPNDPIELTDSPSEVRPAGAGAPPGVEEDVSASNAAFPPPRPSPSTSAPVPAPEVEVVFVKNEPHAEHARSAVAETSRRDGGLPPPTAGADDEDGVDAQLSMRHFVRDILTDDHHAGPEPTAFWLTQNVPRISTSYAKDFCYKSDLVFCCRSPPPGLGSPHPPIPHNPAAPPPPLLFPSTITPTTLPSTTPPSPPWLALPPTPLHLPTHKF